MDWMVEEIGRRGGTVTFRDYMELALYHPRRGYYSCARPRYGRGGDFLTAPTASRWYSAVLAGWCERLAACFGALVVIDVASGDGSLVAGLVERLGSPASSKVDRIVSVERSAAMRAVQARRLRGAPVAIEVEAEMPVVASARGGALLHASELFDALPVHRVVARGDGLREMWVGIGPDGLEWREVVAPQPLRDYLEGHGVSLAPGQIAELNLAAEGVYGDLLRNAGARAAAVVLDYGYEAQRLYHPRGRSGGSLACYRDHRLSHDPLVEPGRQDLSAHINWDDLRWAASSVGWQEIGLWPLAEFLVRAGLEAEAEREGMGVDAELDARTVGERQEIKRLLDPEGMGSDLKVLVQATDAEADSVRATLTLP